MGQYFIFLNLELQQSSHDLGKLAESSIDDCGLSQKITAHYPQPFSTLIDRNECLRSTRSARQGDLGALQKLPNEIISLIAEKTSYSRVIRFAMTNSQILSIVYPTIVKMTHEWWKTFHWAHCRIVYLGSDCDVPLPNGFLPDAFQKRLDHVRDEIDEDDYIGGGGVLDSVWLFRLADSRVFKRAPMGIANVEPVREEYKTFTKQEIKQYKLLRQINTRPPAGNSVLINDTKKLFIKEGQGVLFKRALIPLMIFAGDLQVKYVKISPHGPWAGDRIAIISSEDFATRVDDQWKDAKETGLKAQEDWISFVRSLDEVDS